jgi:hypothetical protein
MKLYITSILLAIGLITQVACTQNQILASMEGALAATQVTLTVLEAENPANAPLYAEISDAISNLPSAFQATSIELSTNDPEALKYTKIASYFAASLQNIDSLPPDARAICKGIVDAIQAFLGTLQPATSSKSVTATNAGSKPIIVPAKDLSTIYSITERLNKLREKSILHKK